MTYAEACRKAREIGNSKKTITLTTDQKGRLYFIAKWEEPVVSTISGVSGVTMLPKTACARIRKKDREVILRNIPYGPIADAFCEAETAWRDAGYPKEFSITL
jgi:hypothetical protein